MFTLEKTFSDRRFTSTTATPKTMFPKKTHADERNVLECWETDVKALHDAAYRYALMLDDAKNDADATTTLFDAWKKLFRYFPEKAVGVRLKADAQDVAELCGYALTLETVEDAQGKHREPTKTSASFFRKAVENMVVDRIEQRKARTPEVIAAEKQKKRDARDAAKARHEKEVAALLGCTQEEARHYIKAQAKKRRLERAQADISTKERAAAKKLDDAQKGQDATDAA